MIAERLDKVRPDIFEKTSWGEGTVNLRFYLLVATYHYHQAKALRVD